MRHLATTLLLCLLTSPEAGALAVLRLAFAGDSGSLPLGASQHFLSPQELSFQRPALLESWRTGIARFSSETESTLSIGGTHFWAGSSASDFRAGLILAKPFTFLERSGTVALGGRFETGHLRARNEKDGTIVSLEERRLSPLVALAYRPVPWLVLGLSVGTGAASTLAVEARWQQDLFELGFLYRRESLAFDISSPEGPARKFTRPALSYDISQTRISAMALGALRTRHLTLEGAWDALHPKDGLADALLQPFERLALRAHWQSRRYAFDDWTTSEGVALARVDLGVRLSRWALGTDLTLAGNRFELRRASTRLATASAWEDNGNITGRTVLEFEIDLQLYLRHLYTASFDTWSFGWSRTFGSVRLATGVQHLEANLDRGGLVYGSGITSALNGHDEFRPALVRALSLTGGLDWTRGPLRLRLAIAQLIPYEIQEESTKKPTPAPTPVPSPATPGPSKLDRLREALATFGGGRLVLIEATHEF